MKAFKITKRFINYKSLLCTRLIKKLKSQCQKKYSSNTTVDNNHNDISRQTKKAIYFNNL